MTNNKLKIIAVISMIIDHFGYYFSYLLNNEIYLVCRIIGRLAMPIFTYLIIEGYFHTSNLKKYLKRLGILALMTQLIVIILDFIAREKTYNIGNIANILFSFVILLILINLFENVINNRNFKSKLEFIIGILIVYFTYKFIDFDYDIYLLVLGLGMYIIKKYVRNDYLYKFLIAILVMVLSIILGNINQFALLSCIPIMLYNGKLGKKSNFIRSIFYYIFPLQHIILYGIYILL